MTSSTNYSSTPLSHSQTASRKRWIVIFILLAVVLMAIWVSNKRSHQNSPDSTSASAGKPADKNNSGLPLTPVLTAQAKLQNLDINLQALGTVTPLNAVTVRSRVEGQLINVPFEEGQLVKQGDLLAVVDPRPFEVQVTLASGQLARDQAILEKAEADLARFQTLLKQESISAQLVDNQASLVRQSRAAVQASQGNLDNAKLQLSFTKITAPISGRLGLHLVGTGNIVRASDPNGIATITQLQPVGVVFSIPEDSLGRVMKLLNNDEKVNVEAYDRAFKEKLGKGRLLAADNQIDPNTGTIKLKAEFSNHDGSLFANQFVNVKLPLETRKNAIVIPSAAVQRGSNGTFVYLVKNDQTVAVTPIKIGSVQAELTSVEAGLDQGATVVIEGADSLRDGVKVSIKNAATNQSTQPAPANAGKESNKTPENKPTANTTTSAQSSAVKS